MPQHKDARLAALEELTSIYEDDSVSAKALESFTGRFKDRIVNMLHDVDGAVSCKAVNLCTVLYKCACPRPHDVPLVIQGEVLILCSHTRVNT
jgi:hypothetical protein